MRLYPVQEAMSAAVCAFDSVDGCTKTVIQTIQAGIPIARCDIVCDKTIGAINKYKKTSYRVAPTVFFEFHGSKPIRWWSRRKRCRRSRKEHGGMDFVWATKPEERTPALAGAPRRLLRLPADPARLARRVDRRLRADLAPRRMRAETMEDVKNYIAPVPLLGHIGDGNFHLMLLVDPAKPEETELAKAFNKRLVERALRMEGTCTGEHGVGMGKIGSMRMELGDDVVDVMRDIKKVFDPDNLMNPGKVVPLMRTIPILVAFSLPRRRCRRGSGPGQPAHKGRAPRRGSLRSRRTAAAASTSSWTTPSQYTTESPRQKTDGLPALGAVQSRWSVPAPPRPDSSVVLSKRFKQPAIA